MLHGPTAELQPDLLQRDDARIRVHSSILASTAPRSRFTFSAMSLRFKINAIFTLLATCVLAILAALEIHATRSAVAEEIEASSRVATQFLVRISATYARDNPAKLVEFLNSTGRIRANDVVLLNRTGDVLYKSPPPTYKAGRDAPRWYAALIMPSSQPKIITGNGFRLIVMPNASRAVLDGWDNLKNMLAVAAAIFLLANVLVFWLLGRWLAPLEVILNGLSRIERGDHHFRLPSLVGKEAREMGRAFNSMARAVEENIEVRHASAEANARLEAQREFNQILHQRIEEDRASLARELHDELGQSLTAIRSISKSIMQHPLVKGGPLEQPLQLLFETAGSTSDAMHRMIPRLRPLKMDDMRLGDAIRDLVSGVQMTHPALKIELEIDDSIPQLPEPLEVAAYRICQEALTNVVRHAGADRAWVNLMREDGSLCMTISDNGIGAGSTLERPGHYGVRNMQERAHGLGGEVVFGTRPEGGLTVRARFPLPNAYPQAQATA